MGDAETHRIAGPRSGTPRTALYLAATLPLGSREGSLGCFRTRRRAIPLRALGLGRASARTPSTRLKALPSLLDTFGNP